MIIRWMSNRLRPRIRSFHFIKPALLNRTTFKYLSSFMSIDNDKKLPVVATTVMTVVDIILDILILKVLNGSMLGFGLATSISYWIAFLILCTHFFKKNILLKLSVRNLPWKELGRIIWRGMPVSVGRVGCTFRCILINGMLATISTSAAISAYSVFRNIDGLFNPFTIGMAARNRLSCRRNGSQRRSIDRQRTGNLLQSARMGGCLQTAG